MLEETLNGITVPLKHVCARALAVAASIISKRTLARMRKEGQDVVNGVSVCLNTMKIQAQEAESCCSCR
jgi:hypothetical protein